MQHKKRRKGISSSIPLRGCLGFLQILVATSGNHGIGGIHGGKWGGTQKRYTEERDQASESDPGPKMLMQLRLAPSKNLTSIKLCCTFTAHKSFLLAEALLKEEIFPKNRLLHAQINYGDLKFHY